MPLVEQAKRQDEKALPGSAQTGARSRELPRSGRIELSCRSCELVCWLRVWTSRHVIGGTATPRGLRVSCMPLYRSRCFSAQTLLDRGLAVWSLPPFDPRLRIGTAGNVVSIIASGLLYLGDFQHPEIASGLTSVSVDQMLLMDNSWRGRPTERAMDQSTRTPNK